MKRSMQTKPSIVFCHGIWADTNEANRSLRSSEKHVLRTGRSGLVRRRSTSKIKRSEWIFN